MNDVQLDNYCADESGQVYMHAESEPYAFCVHFLFDYGTERLAFIFSFTEEFHRFLGLNTVLD